MANPVNARVYGQALNSFGFTANDTISGVGLNTFGFLWHVGGIWGPAPIQDPVVTLWVNSAIQDSVVTIWVDAPIES